MTLLALNIGRPISREQIVEALWPRIQTGREESTLRVHISHLRDLLEPIRSESPQILVTRGSSYMLEPSTVDLDITRFESLAREGRTLLASKPDQAKLVLYEALALWRGRALQDVEYEEFAQDEIRGLELTREEAIENRAEALVETGEDYAAIEDLETLVRTDPTRERPVRLVMRALYRVGRQTDALRVARRHARHLAERGMDPSPQVLHLEDRILSHDPTLLPEGAISPGEVKPGRSVRGYELREEAGTGAIGIVFRAFQPSVGREVAVKAIHPDLAQTAGFVNRFAEEARLVASLEHPHIAPLYDFWREPGGAFLVMRWMDGGSLEDRLGKHWEPHQLARVFDQIADALGYAHGAGVVHRDVKPANVLFDTAGNAYLSDFGLAATGVDTGAVGGRRSTMMPPYASPEVLRWEGPTVASDIFGLGVMLAEAASGAPFSAADTALDDEIREVVQVATSTSPADRYPDALAFRAALRKALGSTTMPAPRRVRRNPYKGLEPFGEADRADFYGRDDVIDTLVDIVGRRGLTAVIGASGSGKSSLVMAGLVPALRDGALPGSEEWSFIHMVPGTDPFEEFHIALRSVAVGHPSLPRRRTAGELRQATLSALDGPISRAVLVVDQFEEIFASAVDPEARERFLDDLVDIALDPAHRVRVVLTLRADFADRPLTHPTLGDLISRSPILLAPMRPVQVEEVIRMPAARVGVDVEPGLIAEIVHDFSDSPAYLPLLQFVLSELFERRAEDRLTVQAYRSLGGVQGVLERRAEDAFAALSQGGRQACRQLFLRMVQLGDHGDETRRRLPVNELHGVGSRAHTDEALAAFSAARLITYDRDPITRTPTIEVVHETVITRWSRYRVWIDEARADLLAHRRFSAAAAAWKDADEDPAYLLTGGPLMAAVDLVSNGRIELNEPEARLVAESQAAAETAEELEAQRQLHAAVLEHRARRRLRVGVAAAAMAVLIGAVAVFAWVQRQRADDLAAAHERQSLARELAAASIANLTAADSDLSLLLAIEGAEQNLETGEEVLREVVEALHLAVINPRPALLIPGGGRAVTGQLLKYSNDGSSLGVLSPEGGAIAFDPETGEELGRVEIPPGMPAAFGIDLHPDGNRVITVHPDAVRQWHWPTGPLERELDRDRLGMAAGDGSVLPKITVAVYSRDGSQIAIGGDDGFIRVVRVISSRVIAVFEGHQGVVTTLDFDNNGGRLASAADDGELYFWDVATAEITAGRIHGPTGELASPVKHLAWNTNPTSNAVVGTTHHGEIMLMIATGERINSFGNANNPSHSVAFDGPGSLMIAAGADGVARIFGTWVGGEAAITLTAGGVPLRDAEFAPTDPADPLAREVATLGADGNIRIWRDLLSSEHPPRTSINLAPELVATPDGTRLAIWGRSFHYGVPEELVPTVDVVDAASGETFLSVPAWECSFCIGRPAITADGSLVAFAGPSEDVQILDVVSGMTFTIPDSAQWIASLTFTDDGALLAGSSADGSIAVWQAGIGEMVRMLSGHGDRVPENVSEPNAVSRVDQVSFRPGSAELASIGFDGTVRVWDIDSGDSRILHSFEYELWSLAYTPDGSRLVVADRTGTVVMLDPDTGELVFEFDRVSGPTELATSPDSRWIAGGGPGPFAHLWDAETGRLLRRLRGSVYAPTSVAFTDEGSQLWVMSTEGTMRGYALDPVDLLDLARAETTRELTDAECERFLHHSCDP